MKCAMCPLVALVLFLLAVVQYSTAESVQSWNPPDRWNATIFRDNQNENTSKIASQLASVRSLDISFALYTRLNRDVGRRISSTEIPSNFVSDRLTWFIVHGWASENDAPWIINLKNAALLQGDYNVIIVSWNSLNILYPQSAQDTLTVGADVTKIARYLVSKGLTQSNLYCIGHSLGAHVCGAAGRGYKFGRITGLDPAGPLFDGASNGKIRPGLTAACANNVDVIHTDYIHEVSFGSKENRGHLDFYPNKGSNQPGCLISLIPDIVGCSHSRAIDLYVSSINQPQNCFRADQLIIKHCSMGWYAKDCVYFGVFTLKTTSKEPFCKNGINVK